jgi:hypothetical protein
MTVKSLFPADFAEERRIFIIGNQRYPCLPQASAGDFF